jgi:hypothetical protein
VSPRLLLALAFAPLAACAPPAEPAAPPAASTAVPASAAPAAPEAPPAARVTAVEVGKESALYKRAKIVFQNPTKRACKFLGYKLVWAGASKAIQLEGLAVPPGETRERWLKVNPGDGDLDKLAPESARVEVQVECG